jgi:hypothetical protein
MNKKGIKARQNKQVPGNEHMLYIKQSGRIPTIDKPGLQVIQRYKEYSKG